MMTRRELLATPALAAVAAPARPELCYFTKYLIDLNYTDLGKALRQVGISGADLTVRKGGHVPPERAPEDLPRAVDALRTQGISVPLIATDIVSASAAATRPLLATAARLKIPFYWPGNWSYEGDVEAAVADAGRACAGLARLNQELGIAAGFHNHSGVRVGAAVWDIRAILAAIDPRWMGYYFDACHAVIEGGLGGWIISLRMALPRIKMVAVKDFYWEKQGGRWRMKMCPMGEGMVEWPKFFSMLAAARYSGPISIHQEYKPKDLLGALARDVEFVKKQIAVAYA